MRFILLVVAVAVLLVSSPAAGQAVRVIAVAEFADDSTGGLLIGARWMNVDLDQYLTEKGQGRVRMVPAKDVQAAMRARGYTPKDLAYPSRAADVAGAVGADWIVTGWWTHLEVENGREPLENGKILPSVGDADAAITIRVMDTATHKILLEDSFWSHQSGAGRWVILRWAAQAALRDAAERILRL